MTRKAAAALAKQDFSTAATPIAAAYYPDWAFDATPPENLDYTKFDILFFGWYPDVLVSIILTSNFCSVCHAQLLFRNLLG